MSDNYLASDGLHLQTRQEIVDQLIAQFQAIYGTDINLDSNSPDRQMIEIFAQSKIDMLECIAQVYNSFSPESAVGVSLDQRSAINGVIRQGSTYTKTNVELVTDRLVSLNGLDTVPANPFTVADSIGNKFYLEATATIGMTGVTGATGMTGVTGSVITTKSFRASEAGLVTTTQNTIQTVATVTLGVTGCNNPTSATTLGEDEETDPQLRFRRQQSVSLPSQGWLDALRAAVLNISGVTDAAFYENNTGSTDSNGITAHTMWAIVEGGTNADIADAIFRKRNAGCGMKGSVSVSVTQSDGSTATMKFDRPINENLYVKIHVTPTIVGHSIDGTNMALYIASKLVYGIYEQATFSAIAALVAEFDSLATISPDTGTGVCLGLTGTYQAALYPSTVQKKFVLAANQPVITVV